MRQNKLREAIRATRQSKRQARELLDAGNNRLYFSLAIILWIASAGAIYLLGAGLAYVADASIFTDQPSALAITLSMLSYVLMIVLALLILVPLAGGIMLLAGYVYRGKTPRAGDLLAAFDSPKQYLRCMGLGLYGLMQPVLSVATALIGCVAIPSLLFQMMQANGARSVLIWLACAGTALLGAAAALAVMVLCRAAYLRGAFLARGKSWHESTMRTREILAKNGTLPYYYHLSFAWHVALCVLTVGVSGVLDGIGHALLCHQFACDAFETQKK